MEKIPNFESRESVIDRLIENLAEKEGMNAEDIFSRDFCRRNGDACDQEIRIRNVI